ncbi:MAG: 5'-3' exonuclease H3TH domain-containing protein [Bacilli bacterium]|jgi:DNA polymerase-1|nr:5'-3' exonuclease H3TH domain-containing protein [Clostridia bacterium]
MKELEKFIIVDGHNLLCRMFFGIQSNIRSTDGMRINAVLGFISSIIKYIKCYEPKYFIVIFDSEQPNYRSEIEKDYKGNRQLDSSESTDDENPFIQLPMIKEILDLLDIKHCEVDGFEADDAIASYANKYDTMQKYIVSGDSDFLQLVDPNTIVFMDRGKKSITYDEKMVFSRFKILPERIVDYKALIGDKSDNISGLFGIGPKTAVNLINTFGCIENIIELSHNIVPKTLCEKIYKGSKTLCKNKFLITLRTDAPLIFNIDDLMIDHLSFIDKKAMDIFREYQYI